MSTTAEDRQVRHRLAILRHAEEVTGNVAMTCRYCGVTRRASQCSQSPPRRLRHAWSSCRYLRATWLVQRVPSRSRIQSLVAAAATVLPFASASVGLAPRPRSKTMIRPCSSLAPSEPELLLPVF